MANVPTFLSFDGMTWPNPEDPRSVEWRLRYGEPIREDLLVAASFIGAYKQLVADSAAHRNAKVAGIRRAMRQPSAQRSAEGAHINEGDQVDG